MLPVNWISRNYGCKRGMLRACYHGLLDTTGRYSPLRRIDWSRVERLVFVCKGNICRSAYAEARARSAGLNAVSYGLITQGGDATPPAIRQVAAEVGIDLSSHRSSCGAAVTLAESDLILAMEPYQVDLLKAGEVGGAQVTLLGLWCAEARPHIEDPYGLREDYIRHCFELIDRAVAAVAERMITRRSR